MIPKGSTQLVLGIIGILLLIGAITFTLTGSEMPGAEMPTSTAENTTTETDKNTTAVTETVTTGAKPETPKPSGTTSPKSPASSPPQTPTETAGTPPETTTPTETAPSVPATTWNPGFQASVRITPEIPSENERATLPSCEGKKFTSDFIEFSKLKDISEGETSASLPDYLSFNFPIKNIEEKFNLTAPGDVYVTHMRVEYAASPDEYDTTIYFALCKDVFGYYTNVKELSLDISRLMNNSECALKPHTGPNACYTKFLDQISIGSALGKVGRLGGSFGFGVIDLREKRELANPAAHSIVTNYSRCPFSYLNDASGMKAKLVSGSILCP